MRLSDLKIGESAYVYALQENGVLKYHLLDMGLIPGTEVTLQKKAPMGDPVQIQLRGYELTLRLADAEKIEIENIHTKNTNQVERKRHISSKHPCIGEMGIAKNYHKCHSSDIIQKAELSFALVGNQNSGKTTLFNQLTGAHQHVGNFPGVTVDKKQGKIRQHPEAMITDLPGIYSLSPYSNEEIVTRDFLIESHPDAIINIVDASNIERNLYLTMQLMELDLPIVLALNMMDEVKENGGTIHINELEEILGIPVVPISAIKNEGIDELIEHALHIARYNELPGRIDFCPPGKNEYDPVGAVHRCIHATIHIIEQEAKNAKLPTRFAATKFLENDKIVRNKLALSDEKNNIVDNLVSIMENETKLDRHAALANMRFSFIESLCKETVVHPHESNEHKRTMMIDKFLTGKYTAIPLFIVIMALIFTMTFYLIGPILSNFMGILVDYIINLIDKLLYIWKINTLVHSLIIDGICNGVGTVISFLPTIVILYLFLSILEDTGYMARIAFVMDRLLRKIGLSGRSIVPMLIGFGCSVPAIMATRTLSSDRDRQMTIYLIPFMSCSAKLPIYTLMVGLFFETKFQPIIMISLYLLGILFGILYALILKKLQFMGEPVPFVMELPNYRIPSLKSVFQLIWEKAKGFIQKAFTIIFIASIVIWFLQTFDIHLYVVKSADQSLLALLGNAITPLFAPLGFDDWRISTSLIAGFSAKENVVSTLTVLLDGNTAQLMNLMTPFTAFVFLVFTLLYTPCIAAIATVRREIGSISAATTVISQCLIAWIVAFAIHFIGLIFGLV